MSTPSRYMFTLARSILHHPGKRQKNTAIIRLFVLVTVLMVPLVLSLSFTEGMIEGITDKYILLLDGHLQVYTESEVIIDAQRSMSKLQGTSDDSTEAGITVDQTVGGYGILYGKDQTQEVYLKGVAPSYFNERRVKELSLGTTEDLARTGVLPGIYLSRDLAEHFGVDIQDRLALVLIPSHGERRVRPALVQVQGIYDTGFYALDQSLVFIDQESGQLLLPEENIRTEIMFESYGEKQAEAFMQSLKNQIDGDLEWARFDQFNTDMYENFATSRQVIYAVFLTILVTAAFYITAVAHELIEDAKEEIAMMKVLGAQSRHIIAGYLLAVTTVTALSIATGTMTGILLAQNITSLLVVLKELDIPALSYYLLSFDVDIPVRKIVTLSVTLLAMSMVSVAASLRHIIHIRPLDVLHQD
ncbi:MAG: ABC transporter permease [Sphaerochaetaceae bacterium]|nr:ABC transporter permease [Sphaerochaetaceae bacterium]